MTLKLDYGVDVSTKMYSYLWSEILEKTLNNSSKIYLGCQISLKEMMWNVMDFVGGTAAGMILKFRALKDTF